MRDNAQFRIALDVAWGGWIAGRGERLGHSRLIGRVTILAKLGPCPPADRSESRTRRWARIMLPRYCSVSPSMRQVVPFRRFVGIDQPPEDVLYRRRRIDNFSARHRHARRCSSMLATAGWVRVTRRARYRHAARGTWRARGLPLVKCCHCGLARAIWAISVPLAPRAASMRNGRLAGEG